MCLGIEVEAVPMYKLVFGPATGKPFHHKVIGNGYVFRFGETRVYFSGHTECVPEMKVLRNMPVAFVAMNLPRTMPPAGAAACVREFPPKIVYAYDYCGQNTQEVADASKNTGIEVRLRKLEGEP
jgi:L-ascorbate metabolism protein UlaG (beta-lactamase superfamily)